MMNAGNESAIMNAVPAISSPSLALKGVAHAFFTREGGASSGVYASLNGGVGSNDDPEIVAENRSRMAQTLGVDRNNLMVPYQVHSPDVLAIDAPWTDAQRPKCDGLVTAKRGLALGVTGADCGIVLFADEEAQVIGACHAGWKGALTGVLEATLERMEQLGGNRARIASVLGPTIAQASYEVGGEFVARFAEADPHYRRFFKPSNRDGHAMFDLPAFIAARLEAAGVGRFENLALDTYADDRRFYSYRRSVHRKESDYGRLVAAIALV